MFYDLNALPLVSEENSLQAILMRLQDPRKKRGIRHSQISVLLVAVAALLSGCLSFRAMGEWAKDLPASLLCIFASNVATFSHESCHSAAAKLPPLSSL